MTRDHNFDIAIVGAGCAGLTLANYISTNTSQSIAIIDKMSDRPNHFWGFWDNGHQALDIARNISQKKWNRWSVRSNETEVIQEGQYSTYRVISLEKFEKIILRNLTKNSRLKRFMTNVGEVKKQSDETFLQLIDGRCITAKTVFDSRPVEPLDGILLQHFLGLTIQSENEIFEPSTAILMDFRVTQEEGIHFIYLLPFCRKTALVESTIFSNTPKSPDWYKDKIQKYLIEFYSCNNFTVQATERGVIPMCLSKPYSSMGIPIGLRAGALRASSGYAFSQIQIQIWELASNFCNNTPSLAKPGCDKFEQAMDEVMLRVLNRYPGNAVEIFIEIFKSLNGDQFADFMGGYSNWSTRLRLMTKLPKYQFLRGLIN